MKPVEEPLISVGIMHGQSIHFQLNDPFIIKNLQKTLGEGRHSITMEGEKILLDRNPVSLPIILEPLSYSNAVFELSNVTIGIDFHWERHENQQFRGSLKFIIDEGLLAAIDVLPLEEYLRSVISSEMNADSPEEFLKAHAVISRSWLLAQKEKAGKKSMCGMTSSPAETIRWWDREDHKNFDVCADDHCQRYQGINKISNKSVDRALEATAGEVLVYHGEICDARFSKCCGGVTERFESAWEDTEHPYLTEVTDAPENCGMDLSIEADAEKWIRSGNQPSFCNTGNIGLLQTILNNYDCETKDFYRWKIVYSQDELSELVNRKMHCDFGKIEALVPVERGSSGRIVRLKIIGTRKTAVIGKELLIRKVLSETHLYSSAFVVDKENRNFVLTGAGWGHGVGLCQIGAAVMASKGYGYKDILTHYFRNTVIEKIY